MSAWQGAVSSVRDRIKDLYERKCFTDVTFVFIPDTNEPTKHTIKAHKIILASASVVFEKMFFGGFWENATQEILIEDTSSETFAAMLKFIYTEELDLKSDWLGLTDLLYVSDKYMLTALTAKSVEALIHLLKPTNALLLYEFADLHSLQNLQDAALMVVQHKTSEVIKSPFFDKIAISTLKTIVEQECLQTSELELFNAIEMLAKRKGAIKSLKRNHGDSMAQSYAVWKNFRTVISQIRFLSMSVSEFHNGPGSSSLLTSDEAYSITVCQSLPERIKNVYPKNFTQKKRQTHLPRVFLDIKAAGIHLGRMVIELRSDIVPQSAENFRSLCLGEHNVGLKGSKLNSINNTLFKIHAFNIKTGFTTPFIPCEHENFTLKHDSARVVGMLTCENNQKSDKNSFYITFGSLPHIKHESVAIGKVIEGLSVLEKIKSFGQPNGVPSANVVIENCGEI